MTSLREVFEDTRSTLSELYEPREAGNIAFELIAHFFEVSKTDILLNKSTDKNPEKFEKALEKLKKNEPLQYVLGTSHFCGLDLSLSCHVLIPRPETEELVHWAASTFQSMGSLKVLDIGSGSGCIALAIKSLCPNASVLGLDVSVRAVEIARQNANRNQLDVEFWQGDFLYDEELEYPLFDALVSNPPYIPTSEKHLVGAQVWKYEPHLALFTSDQDPLIFYRAIARRAHHILKTKGWIFVETNEHNAPLVAQLFAEMGLQNIVLKQDMQGKNRMIKAQKI